jgi:Transmembrane family 220, helix
MMRVVNLILTLLFLSFAMVQYNDPDPWRWAVMYGFVAGICGFAAFGKTNRNLLWAGIAVCLVWLAFWLPDFLDWVKLGRPNIAGHMKAETPYIEFAREFFGLLVCVLTLGWQLWRVRKK